MNATENALTAREQELLGFFRQLTPLGQDAALTTTKALSNSPCFRKLTVLRGGLDQVKRESQEVGGL